MKCFHCQGELERGLTTFTDSRRGYVIVLQEIPAWICLQCGEPLFDREAVRGIQDLLQATDERVERLRWAA